MEKGKMRDINIWMVIWLLSGLMTILPLKAGEIGMPGLFFLSRTFALPYSVSLSDSLPLPDPILLSDSVALVEEGERCEPEKLGMRVAFYNLENFFHPSKDSLKRDDDFTPTGMRGWGNSKFYQKRNRIFKVLNTMDAENPLLAIGVAEVENAVALRELCLGTPLRYRGIRFVHFESPDPRGIDVALLYRSDLLEVDTAFPVPLVVPPDTVSRTRDILYVRSRIRIPGLGPNGVGENDSATLGNYENGIVSASPLIHFFVCHFPSKYGGAAATDPKRAAAAYLLRRHFDSIYRQDSLAYIIAMGDMNTHAHDPVLRPLDEYPLCNLMAAEDWKGAIGCQGVGNQRGLGDRNRDHQKMGSHKYRQEWSTIDHIIVSPSLKETLERGRACLFNRDFLLQEDDKYLGVKPFRSFYGSRYLGGYSDHLPVFIDLELPLQQPHPLQQPYPSQESPSQQHSLPIQQSHPGVSELCP